MLNKLKYAVGLAAAVGASTALAAAGGDDFDLDVTGGDAPRLYATEALSKATADVTTVGTTAYYEILGTDTAANAANGINDLDVTAKLGVGVSNGAQIFVRYDLTNAVFTAAPTTAMAAGAGVGTATSQLAQGGASQSFAIFQLTATNTSVGQASVVNLLLNGAANTSGIAITGTGNVTLDMNVYETLTAATSKGTALASKTSSKGFVNPVSGLSVNIAQTNETGAALAPTAEVSSNFTLFTSGSAATGSSQKAAAIGVADTKLNTTTKASDRDGTVAVIGDLINTATSTAKLSGDFTDATVKLAATAAGCNAGATQALATDKQSTGAITVATLNGAPVVCLSYAGTKTIPKQSVTAAFTLVSGQTSAALPPGGSTGTVGSIAHNGTTVEFPYLTTFKDYNQRVVMVNRSSADVTYSFSFTPEDGVTAANGTMATGTVKKNSTAVVKVSDIVTLTGGTRAAGTVVIVAPKASISVATTQVNLSDGGTDTISLL